jgi:hypothetical protein
MPRRGRTISWSSANTPTETRRPIKVLAACLIGSSRTSKPGSDTRVPTEVMSIRNLLSRHHGGWRLYSVFTSPQAFWFNGALGIWSALWYDFVCIDIDLTPIGPGFDYLWAK